MVADSRRSSRDAVASRRFRRYSRARAATLGLAGAVIVRKTDVFIADVERQFDWDAVNASWQVAELYLAAIDASCAFVGHYPSLGSRS